MPIRFLFLLVTLTIFACQRGDKPLSKYRVGEREVVIYAHPKCDKELTWLPVAKVKICLPERYDTYHEWWKKSCTVCDGSIMHRFAQSENCHYEEGQIDCQECIDSIDNVTISSLHVMNYKCMPSSALDSSLLLRNAERFLGYYPKSILVKRMNNDFGVHFSFSEYEKHAYYQTDPTGEGCVISSNIKKTHLLDAMMHKDSTCLMISFACRGDDFEGFKDRAYNILKSIDIERFD